MTRRRFEREIRKGRRRKAFSRWLNRIACKVSGEEFVVNQAKAKKMFDKAFSRLVGNCCLDDLNCILVSFGDNHNGYGDFCTQDFTSRILPRRWRYYFSLVSDQYIQRLVTDCEIEGYSKMLLQSKEDWYVVREKFGWWGDVGGDDDKAIVFYLAELYGM